MADDARLLGEFTNERQSPDGNLVQLPGLRGMLDEREAAGAQQDREEDEEGLEEDGGDAELLAVPKSQALDPPRLGSSAEHRGDLGIGQTGDPLTPNPRPSFARGTPDDADDPVRSGLVRPEAHGVQAGEVAALGIDGDIDAEDEDVEARHPAGSVAEEALDVAMASSPRAEVQHDGDRVGEGADG